MDYIAHHGIKGMRWGVRRYQNPDGSLTPKGKKRYSEVRTIRTKSGDTLYSLRKKERDNDSYSYVVRSKESGKKVARLFLERESKRSLNVNWINVDKVNRGKGYAQAIMEDVDKIARRDGFEQLTLEVPSISPDARHIYEKQGFKAVGTLSKDDVWDGLTSMRKELKK